MKNTKYFIIVCACKMKPRIILYQNHAHVEEDGEDEPY